MLTLEQRPQTFRDMAGQDIVKKSLLHICKDPYNAPKTLLLCGPYGSGKTTAARIFARALNCEHKLPNGDACVDADTEFFDGHTWKKIKDYKEGDLVLQYNEDGTATLVKPLRYIKESCDSFNHLYGKNFDIVATDDHDLVYLNRSNKLSKMKCSDFIYNHNTIDNIRAKFISSFDFSGEGIPLSDIEIRLQVAVIADGNYIPTLKNPNYCRVNFKKRRKYERLKSLLIDSGIDYKEFNYSNGYHQFKFNAPLYTKVFNDYWYNCNKHQMEVIADELLYWDGCKSQNQFSTSEKETRDFVQFLYACLGKRCHITEYKADGINLLKDNYTLTIANKGYVDTSSSHHYKYPVDYYISKDGYKYCFTVPSHMWVSRRNFKIVVTGNCGECPSCKSDIQDSMFYSEYDAAIVGNVDAVKELRNSFYFGYSKGFKVIVLDEVHLVSKQAQGALLKVFEEPEPNVFFLLCTTDPEKLLPTIVSRSFELRYDTVGKDDMINHLKKVIANREEPLTLPEDVVNKNLELIFDRSHGHMRNAMMLLDSMFLLKEDFQETVKDSKELFIKLFKSSVYFNDYARQYGLDQIQNSINETIHQLTTFPISNLKQDYEKLVLELTKHTFYSTDNPQLVTITKPFGKSFELLNILNDKTIYNLFNNETQFQIAMHILSNRIRQIKRV